MRQPRGDWLCGQFVYRYRYIPYPPAVGTRAGRLAEALALLAQQPGIGTAYEGARAKGVRRLLVGRIRYFIYYHVTTDTLAVLAVWHVSRGKQPSL